MHEMSIAQSLVQIINEEMAKNNIKALRSVHLHIGQMTAIVPEALSFFFGVIVAGTQMDGVRLEMDIVPLKGCCRECGFEFQIDDYSFICPACKAANVEIIEGKGMTIVEMEVE